MKRFLTPLVSLTILFTILVVPTYLTLAQTPGSSGPGGTPGSSGPAGTGGSPGSNGQVHIGGGLLDNPFGGAGNSLKDLFVTILNNIVLPIGGVIAVLSFVYSGFLYVMAQGDEKKISTAHNALLYTAVGTAVLLGASAIAKVVENTINNLK